MSRPAGRLVLLQVKAARAEVRARNQARRRTALADHAGLTDAGLAQILPGLAERWGADLALEIATTRLRQRAGWCGRLRQFAIALARALAPPSR